MKYSLFLFDLDDTLLDFRASERLSFARIVAGSVDAARVEAVFADYQAINHQLWVDFEQGRVSKDVLKVERFRRVFSAHAIDADPVAASHAYLESLPDTVVLVDGAREACEALSTFGEIGIITNGIQQVQNRRIANSGLADLVTFVATSEECGHAKPDVRFFEYSVRMARAFTRPGTVVIGDRLDADVLGANRFGIDSCWFNPHGLENAGPALPTHEVDCLRRLPAQLAG